MANTKKNTPVDLTKLSQEELLEFAQEAQAKLAELETKFKEANEKAETAEGKVQELAGKIEGLEKDVDEALKLNGELQKENSADPSKPLTISVNKEKYQVMIKRFNHAGSVYTAEDLKSNKKLVDELIEAGSGVLQKVEG